jgi:predicted amidohydrolase YtcJ
MNFILALFSGLMGAQTADLAVTGARIYTLNPKNPVASAIAVKDGKVLAVGDNMAPYLGSSTRRIDAKGTTIVPGLIDSHVHMRSLGDSLEILDLRATQSAEQIAEIIRRAARDRKPGEWIRGRSWDQTTWPLREFPNADLLSKAAPNNPVYLTRVDGHAAWVNQKALEIADINSSTPDPPGGRILHGVLIDRAQELVSRHIPADTPEQIQQRIARAARECARLGLTSVHDAGITAEDLAAYRRLIADRKLPVRVYAMIGGEGPLWREYLRRGPEVSDRLTVRSIKLFADGALGSRGAAMLAPYSDDPGNTGLLILKESDIERVAREAVAHGFQVNTHAIGDHANRTVLQAYAAALKGKNEARFRIEHAQVVALEDLPLFAKYSIVASMQSTHATSDMRWAEARLGPERIQGAYAWRRFLALGVPFANGSDFPVEDPNPLWGFYAAITRQDHAGAPAGGWFPGQRLTRQEALQSWTTGGAYAAFEEKTKGSLEPGKLADFVMLSRDIMTAPEPEILTTRVKMTVVGGEIVYSE